MTFIQAIEKGREYKCAILSEGPIPRVLFYDQIREKAANQKNISMELTEREIMGNWILEEQSINITRSKFDDALKACHVFGIDPRFESIKEKLFGGKLR